MGDRRHNRADRFLGRAFEVGIFDTQDELALVLAREGPVEQRRARAADMQISGRAGGEAGADHGRDGGEGAILLPAWRRGRAMRRNDLYTWRTTNP